MSPSKVKPTTTKDKKVSGGLEDFADLLGTRYRVLLLALRSRRLKFISRLPADQIRQARGFPSQGETEARHGRISHEIHLRMIFVAGLVIVLLDVLVLLIHAPRFRMPLELHPFVN